MTLNANGIRPNEQSQQFLEECRRHRRYLNRRWNLLARFHALPERGWSATGNYLEWLSDEFAEVADSRGYRQELVECGEISGLIRDQQWLAFTAGGATSFIRTFEFASDRVAEFAAGSLYVRDLSFSAADVRTVRREITAITGLLRSSYADVLDLGEARAEWWIANRRKEMGRRFIPGPRVNRATGTQHPPGYADLLDLQIAREQHAIH
jgi:hypothetical protein